MNCRRYFLPSNIPPQYFHKLKTDSKKYIQESSFTTSYCGCKWTHAQGVQSAYQRAHIYFQSSSSCNISTVNSLDQWKLKLEIKCVDTDITSVSGLCKCKMLGVSTLQRTSKLIWWTTSPKIAGYYIDHGSIGIQRCSMQFCFAIAVAYNIYK